MMLPENNRQVEVKNCEWYTETRHEGRLGDAKSEASGMYLKYRVLQLFISMRVESRYRKACPGFNQKFILRFWWVRSFWGGRYHQKVKQFANIGNRNMGLWQPISMVFGWCGGLISLNWWGDPSANMGTKVEIEKMGCSTRFLRFEPWMSIKEASFRGNTQLLVGSLVFSAPPTLLTLYAREAYI